MVSDAEQCVTDDAFEAIAALFGKKYEMRASEDGNEIFLTNRITNLCFTLTVKQDE